jgi:Ferritin-like
VRTPQIVWRAPLTPARFWPLDAAEVTRLTHRMKWVRLRFALESAGIPEVAGARTPREDAIGLLMLAAEVEHALMVQYLYAAQSLRGADARSVVHIAVQEMGHLLTVQNLLLALTGANAEGIPSSLHLGRDGLRRNSPRNPLPFTLERITHETLAKFVVIESPLVLPDALRVRIDALIREVVNGGVEPNPVFALYAAIRWIFQGDDTPDDSELSVDAGLRSGWHIGDTDFVTRQIIDRFAANLAEWHSVPGFIAAPVHDRSGALAAIDAITVQGEGLPGGSGSHFESFLALLDRFEGNQIRVRDLPRTPWITGQPTSEDGAATQITNPYSALWSQMFNLQYELLLVEIAWAYCQPRPNAQRQALIDLSVDTMNLVIQPLSADAITRPLGSVGPQLGGPTYGLLDETIPRTRAEYIARFARLTDREKSIANAIRASPEFPDDAIADLRLQTIQSIGDRLIPLVQP